MKKKKFLSLILSVMMLSGIFTIPAHAAGEYVNDADMEGVSYTLGTGSWIVSYDPAADETTLAATEMTSANGNYNVGNRRNAGVYRLPLPEIPAGKTIESAEFRMTSYYPTARYMTYSYMMPGDDWNMATVTVGDMQELIDGANLGSGDTYLANTKTGDEYVSGTNYRNRYDATEYVQEAVANGQENIWFAVTYHGTIKAYRHNYSGCEAKLFYTLKDVPAFELEETTPTKGAQKNPISGEAVFTFSDDVKFATAAVGGADAEVVIDGNTVTVPYESREDTLCSITVTASDKYGQKITETLTFRTARDIIDAQESALGSSYCSGEESNSIDTFTPVLKLSDGGAAFYKLPAPEAEEEKYLSTYKLTMLVKFPEGTKNALDEAKNIRAYAIGDEYDFENGLYISNEENSDSSNVAFCMNDYDSNKAGDIKAYETDEENTVVIEVELTSLARGKSSDFIVALTSTSGAEFASADSADTKILYEIENNPRIKFHSPETKIWGCELTYAAFGVYTDPRKLADYVTITDDSGFEAEGVSFAYNPHSNRIELSESVVLNEFTNYMVVIREGATDSFGNTLDDEVEIAFFETGKYIAVSPEEKDELWSIFTSSDDKDKLSEKWNLFVEVFEIDVPSYDEISDTDIFFERTAQNEDRANYASYSDENAEKLCEIFETIASKVSKEQEILGKISSVAHMSQIEKLITDEENAKILGIEEYIEDYESLYSTESVDKKLMNAEYKDAAAFRDIFVPALEKALKNNEKPSKGSGVGSGASKPSGSASGSFGNPGVNPPIVATPEEEIKSETKFSDMAGYEWAFDAIEYLAAKSVVNGRADGIFAPGEKVTRAEFITMIVNAFGWYNKDATSSFTDVTANDWFSAHVASGADKGIVKGSGASFNPNANITREDMAVIAFRALLASGKTLNGEKSFTDNAVMADYAIEAIGKMAGSGVLSGMPDGSFEPKRNLTRAEAAVVIYNMLTKLS
ncbi:MAG: S-layer homology domain-containing protein [Clostridia bacterium]|nr:S-layer homology domain-containing protein [Clostridia bacterium]